MPEALYRLIVTLDKRKIDERVFSQGTVTIGRNSDNDLRLDDPTVSGLHAKIIAFFKPTYVQDWSSTNGTYVNGERVAKRTLEHGDVITIGKHKLIFDAELADAPTVESQHTLVLSDEELALLNRQLDETSKK